MDLSFLIPDTSPIEIVVRGSITFLFIYLLLRVLKRQSGAVSTADLLLIVLVADAAQNSMAGQYTSVADGLLLVTTIAVWAYVLDWLGYHVKAVERFTHPAPRPWPSPPPAAAAPARADRSWRSERSAVS